MASYRRIQITADNCCQCSVCLYVFIKEGDGKWHGHPPERKKHYLKITQIYCAECAAFTQWLIHHHIQKFGFPIS